MVEQLYWIHGLWPGRLGVAARLRGGDWLEDDITAWKVAGIDKILSLLTTSEEKELELEKEAEAARTNHIEFVSFPIEDCQVPSSEAKLRSVLEELDRNLSSGKNVVIHCRQGIGRSGLVATCLMITRGWDAARALERLSDLRGLPIPETAAQRKWIEHYAATLAGSK